MSHRAIERLRRERESQLASSVDDIEDSDEDDNRQAKKSSVFAAAVFDDDSDSDSDDRSDSRSGEDTDVEIDDPSPLSNDQGGSTICLKKNNDDEPSVANTENKKGQSSDVDDLDAILQEYKLQDGEQEENIPKSDGDLALMQYSIITSEMEIRDLDIEFVRRSLFEGVGVGDGESRSSSRQTRRYHHMFGTHCDNYPRPPHYRGGGIGFQAYTDSKESSYSLPWPYCDAKEGDFRCPPLQNWFEIVHSDDYKRDYADLQIIKDSGDPNALLLFVAHHPYVVEALLQISIVMYEMNQRNEGLSFLKRALWIFECAAPKNFLNVKNRCAIMDHQKEGNKAFFSALFRLIRVSYIGGLTRTALAASQFLLSLDPLRDPMNILLSMDHFTQMCNTESSKMWLIDFVESEKVYVSFRDDESTEEFQCQLLDLPNWGFSYALALFTLCKNGSLSGQYTIERANNAIKMALSRFPSVVGQLLAKNEVDTNSCSLQFNWPAALKYLDELVSHCQKRFYDSNSDSFVRARTSQAYDVVVRIFVQQNFKLWSSSTVLKWMYDNLMAIQEETDSIDRINAKPLSPAIIRYINADPVDYEDKFRTMPADVNPIDPNIVELALNVDPNRRRLVRRNHRQGNGNFFDENFIDFENRSFFGPATEIIDPDLPLLEVFWRSALPWAHVEGVPPPNR